jgi:hypothetical protein
VLGLIHALLAEPEVHFDDAQINGPITLGRVSVRNPIKGSKKPQRDRFFEQPSLKRRGSALPLLLHNVRG